MKDEGDAKVGVAIPVYNGAKVLAAAVSSIQAQTLTAWEIVIVDDGSTDGTASLADELAAKDGRIRVIHQNNQGSYMARLNGILSLETDYFTSVDADDTIEPDMFEVMYELAKRENLDLVECDLSVDSVNTGRVDLYENRESVRHNYIEPVYLEGKGFLCVCGKLYRRELLSKLSGGTELIKTRATLFDDVLFNAQILYAVNSYGCVHKPYYRYRITTSSSVRNFNPKVLSGFLMAVQGRSDFASEYGIKPDDERLMRWTAKNALNLIMLAASAKQKSLLVNVSHVKSVLSLPCVVEVSAKRKVLGFWQYWMFYVLKHFPVILFVACIKVRRLTKG